MLSSVPWDITTPSFLPSGIPGFPVPAGISLPSPWSSGLTAFGHSVLIVFSSPFPKALLDRQPLWGDAEQATNAEGQSPSKLPACRYHQLPKGAWPGVPERASSSGGSLLSPEPATLYTSSQSPGMPSQAAGKLPGGGELISNEELWVGGTGSEEKRDIIALFIFKIQTIWPGGGITTQE